MAVILGYLTRSPSVMALAALNLVLAGLLVATFKLDFRVPSPEIHSRATQLPALSSEPVQAQTDESALGQATEITTRPVFHASRQPWRPPPTAAPVVETVNPIEAYRLAGIIDGTGGMRWAYLRHSASGEVRRVGVAEIVEGWTVVAIAPDLVEFSKSNQTQVMGLEDGGQQNSLPATVQDRRQRDRRTRRER